MVFLGEKTFKKLMFFKKTLQKLIFSAKKRQKWALKLVYFCVIWAFFAISDCVTDCVMCTPSLGSFIMSKIGRITLATFLNPSFPYESAEKIKKKFFFESWEVPHSTFLKISNFRRFWAFFGPNLAFLWPLRPSEGFLTLFLGYFDILDARNT